MEHRVEVERQSDAHSTRHSGPGMPYEFHGCEPPHSNVPRTVDVTRGAWESFLKCSLGRPASGMFTNFFQAQDDYDYYEDFEPDSKTSTSVLAQILSFGNYM